MRGIGLASGESSVTFCRRPSQATEGSSGRKDNHITTPLDTTVVDIISELGDHFSEVAYGTPVPVGATTTYSVAEVCSALGVPVAEWPHFTRAATDFLDPSAIEQLYWHLDVMIADRCTFPRDDLLSALIGMEIDGDGLTVDDLHTIVAVLLAGAGIE